MGTGRRKKGWAKFPPVHRVIIQNATNRRNSNRNTTWNAIIIPRCSLFNRPSRRLGSPWQMNDSGTTVWQIYVAFWEPPYPPPPSLLSRFDGIRKNCNCNLFREQNSERAQKSRLHAIRQPEKRIVLQLVQNSVRYFQMEMEIKNTPLDCAATRTHSVWHPSKCDLFCVCEANRNDFCRARQNWVKLWLYWRFGGEHLKNKLCFVRDMRTHILVSINIWMTCSTNPWKNNFLAFSLIFLN